MYFVVYLRVKKERKMGVAAQGAPSTPKPLEAGPEEVTSLPSIRLQSTCPMSQLCSCSEKVRRSGNTSLLRNSCIDGTHYVRARWKAGEKVCKASFGSKKVQNAIGSSQSAIVRFCFSLGMGRGGTYRGRKKHSTHHLA